MDGETTPSFIERYHTDIVPLENRQLIPSSIVTDLNFVLRLRRIAALVLFVFLFHWSNLNQTSEYFDLTWKDLELNLVSLQHPTEASSPL